MSLCVFGALAAILIYGGIMNRFRRSCGPVSSTGRSCWCITSRASPWTWSTPPPPSLFLWFAAEPMLEKLDRIKVKYGLIETETP